MNNTYSMKEIIELFYNQILVTNNPEISEMIKQAQEYVEEHQDVITTNKQNINVANQGLEQLPDYTDREKEYLKTYRNSLYNPNQLFDLAPLADFLKGIEYSGVYIKNEDGTLKDAFTNEMISKDDISQKQGNILVITPSYNKNIPNLYRFTVVGNLRGMSTVVTLNPKNIEKNYMPQTGLSNSIYITIGENHDLYIDDSMPKRYQLNYFMLSDEEKINQRIINYMLSLNPLVTEPYKFIDSIKNIYPDLDYFRYLPADGSELPSKRSLIFDMQNIAIDNSTYFNMLYRTKDVAKLYEKLMPVQTNKNGYREFSITGSFKKETESSRLTTDELSFVYSLVPKQSAKLEENQNKVEKPQDIVTSTPNNETLNKPLLENIAAKTKDQIINLAASIIQLKNAGMNLSPMQEQILFISSKLQSAEFQEFQDKRPERLQKQQELREKIQKESEARENWQNSPEHPNNLSQNRLAAWKKELVALEQVYAINPSLLTEEQISYISKIKETIEMYTKENNREHEIDTGMSNESQTWYQQHYTGMRR